MDSTTTTDPLIEQQYTSAESLTESFLEKEKKHNRRALPGWLLYAAIPGLSLTTGLSIFLVYITSKNKTYTGEFYNDVVEYRATVQFFVQVVSHLLGLIFMFVLTALFNTFTRSWLQKHPITLDCLKWWTAMCSGQLDLSLPTRFLLPLLLFVLLSLLPAAFWAGAITPVATTKNTTLSFQIPRYGADPTTRFWNASIGEGSPNITRTVLGSFSYAPVRNVLGSMLDGASTATALKSASQPRRKLDNSGYAFDGRSFGVGASVGMTNLSTSQLKEYTFFEDGYKSDINCWYNDTMDFHVYLGQTIKLGGYPNLYQGCGVISSGSDECATVPGYGDGEVVVLLGNPWFGRNVWGMATGQSATRYASLNRTSCEVVFTQQRFKISVDVVEKLINVTTAGSSIKDIDPSSSGKDIGNGMVANNTVQQIGMVIQTSASGFFSPLGNSLISNIANTQESQSTGFTDAALNETQINLIGISTALESMVDDILISLASAQFVIAGTENEGRQDIEMDATIMAIRIGQADYVYVVAGINILLVLVFVVGAIRNKGWREGANGSFDYRDVRGLVVGGSAGGVGLAREVVKRRRRGEDIGDEDADADGEESDDSEGVGSVKIQLEGDDDAYPKLVLAE